MEWFYANGKPFIKTLEARARVLRAHRLERPRQQRGPHSTVAYGTSNGRLFRRSVSAIQFDDDCSFTFSYTSVVPVSVYPPHFPTFGGSSYEMVQHTPPGSLFVTGPSGSDHHAADDEDADETEEDDDDDDGLVRRNPHRNRHAPGCGTGGHRRH
ncbi:hypothetical protein V6N13_091260 [Hibiscus sabdariffa]